MACAAEPRRAADRAQPEAEQLDRVLRDAERREQILEQPVRVLQQRRHQAAIGAGVGPELRHGLLEVLVQQHRRPVVERVGDAEPRLDPLQPVRLERERAQVGREDARRMRGRADVVSEPGERQLGRSRAAADLGVPFDHEDLRARLREPDPRREPVGPRADDDRVRHASLAQG